MGRLADKRRLYSLDIIKTISIISIFLYHLGILKNGYLGVEAFFVVSGYSFAKKVTYSNIKKDVIHPVLEMLKKRYFLIVVACLFILAFGFFFVFPIYYKSFGYESVAALLLSSNVLQAIKSTDYWNVANTTNPLMHMWYICVLIKCLALVRLLLWAAKKFFKNLKPVQVYISIFAISFLLYLVPSIPTSYKFYLVPFRMYEIVLGCLLFEFEKVKPARKNYRIVSLLTVSLLVLILCVGNITEITKMLGMFAVLFLTAVFIYCEKSDYAIGGFSIKKIICTPGRFSFPIYIWHQIVIALSFLLFFDSVNAVSFIFIALLTVLLVFLTECLSRKKFVCFVKKNKYAALALILATFLFAGLTYYNKGVYFRYSELGLADKKEDPDRWIAYVDRVYSWEKDFEEDGRVKVLVVGNSFGRDFANILSESSVSKQLDISYIPDTDNRERTFEEMKPKIDSADIVFYSVDLWKEPSELLDYCYDKLIIVGNKCFSKNSRVWLKRHSGDYYSTNVEVSEEFLQHNDEMKEKYGDHYIDMMSYILVENNYERVFTEDKYYISVDGKHLSQEGAMFYAHVLNVESLLSKWLNGK